MKTTTNYNLRKPDYTDASDIDVINSDLDTIDGELKSLSNGLGQVENNKLDTSSVYNGLDKSTSGYALDARQGKVLNDGLSSLNDSVSSLGTYVTFTPTFVSSITDIMVRTAIGFYNPITKMCFLTIYIVSNNGLIPTTNNTICTIPSTYKPSEDIQFPALVIPKSSEGWSDVRTEACALTAQGVIRLGNFIYGATPTKMFAINVTYFC